MFDGTYEDYLRAARSGTSKTATLSREQWEAMRAFDCAVGKSPSGDRAVDVALDYAALLPEYDG